jgi:hypothetical protein
MKAIARDYLFSQEFNNEVNVLNNISEARKRVKRLREELVFNYGLRALYDVGWTVPSQGDFVEIGNFFGKHGVLKSHDKLLVRILSIITEEGLLRRATSTRWIVSTVFPNEAQVHQKLRELHAEASMVCHSIFTK